MVVVLNLLLRGRWLPSLPLLSDRDGLTFVGDRVTGGGRDEEVGDGLLEQPTGATDDDDSTCPRGRGGKGGLGMCLRCGDIFSTVDDRGSEVGLLLGWLEGRR